LMFAQRRFPQRPIFLLSKEYDKILKKYKIVRG